MTPIPILGQQVYQADPELLRPPYRARFEQEMQTQLDEDVVQLKNLIFDDSDVDIGLDILRRWAGYGHVRTSSGRTYFDVFLGRLRSDYWYRDYLVTTGAHHTYFDSLFDWAGSRAGEVSTLVAQHSREFGAYRPAWALVESAIKPQSPDNSSPVSSTPGKGPAINQELVTRSADLILDMLSGRTSKKDSKVIADTITGLPGPEQAAVLNDIMGRYDETKWFGLVGKYGEANKSGMLYWFFEDMTGDDKERVQKSLVDNHVLKPEVADTLVRGRGLISRTLPFTTGKISEMAEERVEYWADKANEGSKMAYLWGTLDSLFLPQNLDTTVETILMARVLPKGLGAISEASPLTGKILAAIGTGIAVHDVSTGLLQLILDKDLKTGQSLDTGQKIANALNLGANLIFLGAGIAGGRKSAGGTLDAVPVEDPKLLAAGEAAAGEATHGVGKALPTGGGLPALYAPGGVIAPSVGSSQVEWRVTGVNEQTGEITAVARSGNDYAIARINGATLDGELIHPGTGRVIPIRGGVPVEPQAAITEGAPASDVTPGNPGADIPSIGSGEPQPTQQQIAHDTASPKASDQPVAQKAGAPKSDQQPDLTSDEPSPKTQEENPKDPAPPDAKTVDGLQQQRIENQKRIDALDRRIAEHRAQKQKYYDRATQIEKDRSSPDFRELAAKAKRQAQNQERLATEKEAEINRLEAENRSIENKINPQPKPSPSVGPGPGQPRGGAHNDIPTAGGERNHIPPDSVSPLSTGKGPAIWMETADHRSTKSWGSSSSAKAWRSRQALLIKQGRFRDAAELDIQDIQEQFGDKYAKGIQEMRAYIDSLNPIDLRP